MDFTYAIEGGNFTKAGYASSEIKKVLKQLNLDIKVIKKVVIALYEAEVNIAAHAFNGQLIIDINSERIDIQANDEGPGIPDIEMAMKEGFTTASPKVREMGFGAGMGLPNIKRNTDLMTLSSKVGVGTNLRFVINLK